MDVRSRHSAAKRPDSARRGPQAFLLRTATERELASERTGEVLGRWQAYELRIAQRFFPECRGLSIEELEDIYQETVEALLNRRFQREEHLRHSLREGIRYRALNLYRDERRREEILTHTGADMHVMAQANEDEHTPEDIVLAHEDRLIAAEFKTELSEKEQRVFAWMVEGLQYRAIASVLKIPVNEARNTARSCERKRERFQLLYDTGRLCGYRATTIQALQNGEATNEELAVSAFAHLDRCLRCREEHKTNANRLRASFREQAAALLPPVLLSHLDWLTRLSVRARTVRHRLLTDGLPLGQGGVRERAAALLTGSGITAKVATTVATVAVIAGGTIGIKHALQHPPARHPHHSTPSAITTPSATGPATGLVGAAFVPPIGASVHRTVHTPRRPHHSSPGRVLTATRPASRPSAASQHEPGGFAYLGVPTTTSASSTPASAPEQPHTAVHSSGGPFSP